MSQWRKYNAQVLENVKMDTLEKACEDMGVRFDTSIKSVGNTYGESAKVDAGLFKDGQALPLGFIFKREDGKIKLELEGDFWRTGLDERTFVDLLSRSYQKYNIIEQVTGQGWLIDRNEIDADGNVILEAVQW